MFLPFLPHAATGGVVETRRHTALRVARGSDFKLGDAVDFGFLACIEVKNTRELEEGKLPHQVERNRDYLWNSLDDAVVVASGAARPFDNPIPRVPDLYDFVLNIGFSEEELRVALGDIRRFANLPPKEIDLLSRMMEARRHGIPLRAMTRAGDRGYSQRMMDYFPDYTTKHGVLRDLSGAVGLMREVALANKFADVLQQGTVVVRYTYGEEMGWPDVDVLVVARLPHFVEAMRQIAERRAHYRFSPLFERVIECYQQRAASVPQALRELSPLPHKEEGIYAPSC